MVPSLRNGLPKASILSVSMFAFILNSVKDDKAIPKPFSQTEVERDSFDTVLC
jgi:hypothetical protein